MIFELFRAPIIRHKHCLFPVFFFFFFFYYFFFFFLFCFFFVIHPVCCRCDSLSKIIFKWINWKRVWGIFYIRVSNTSNIFILRYFSFFISEFSRVLFKLSSSKQKKKNLLKILKNENKKEQKKNKIKFNVVYTFSWLMSRVRHGPLKPDWLFNLNRAFELETFT